MNPYLIIFIIVSVVIAIYLIRGMTTRGFTTGIAKTNLRSFLMLKEKYPNENKLEIYKKTLLLRPTYTEEKVGQVLNNALGYTSYGGMTGFIQQKDAEKAKRELRLWMVILALAVHEYVNLRKDVQGLALGIKIEEMEKEIRSIIPVDL